MGMPARPPRGKRRARESIDRSIDERTDMAPVLSWLARVRGGYGEFDSLVLFSFLSFSVQSSPVRGGIPADTRIWILGIGCWVLGGEDSAAQHSIV